jgi:molybdopterin synthase catalytic subunit|tara:strand:- start:83 stop:502 length:420 start_codon:yes stop_codon:yes gene_type:complete
MVKAEIVNGPIDFFPSEDNRQQDGAELVFNGRVRATEDDKNITALEYEYYEGMAEEELTQLAEKTMNKFPIHDLFCRHRIGSVDVGETSLHVSIWSKHRREGLDAMDWFISELKKCVPIWKWAILEDGTRIPSECEHDH